MEKTSKAYQMEKCKVEDYVEHTAFQVIKRKKN